MSMTTGCRKIIKKLPFIRDVIRMRDECGCYCPGHFHSPIPSLSEIRSDEASIWRNPTKEVPGIEMREKEQLELLDVLSQYYHEIPFPAHKSSKCRYYYENPTYSYSDAIILYSLIRHLRPRQIIEVGSGFSTCVSMDTNEFFFQNSIRVTCIEPYPERLLALIKNTDKNKINLFPQKLQDIDLDTFKSLKANDILFFDSTHVSKINSDVNHIFFKILPIVPSGVYIHFHDIFFPFEYPREWVYAGRAWNEAYILKAFLQHNDRYQIVFMNTFLKNFHEDVIRQKMPLWLKNGGGGIWIYKK